MIKHLIFSVFLLFFALALGADAKIIYVNNMIGDDASRGLREDPTTDRSGPVKTIQRALELAGSSDTIMLASNAEPYRESVSLCGLRNSGTSTLPFRIVGNGATLDGTQPISPLAWRHYEGHVFRFRPPLFSTLQLFVSGRPIKRVPVDASGEFGGPQKTLKKLEWCLVDGYVYLCLEKGFAPVDYDLTYSALKTGITARHVRHVVIENVTVQGYHVDGIHVQGRVKDLVLLNTTTRGCGRAGMAVGSAEVRLERVLSGNNGEAQLLTLPDCKVEIVGSDLMGNTAPAWVASMSGYLGEVDDLYESCQVYVDKKRIWKPFRDLLPDGKIEF